jgi:uncharacterized protein (DUF58 family)
MTVSAPLAILPTRRLVLLSILPLAVALSWVFVEPSLVVLAAIDAVLLVVVVIDAVIASGAVDAERRHAPVWSVGERTPVVLRIRNAGRRHLDLEVHDDAPAVPEGLPAVLSLAPGDAEEVSYAVRMEQRGHHRFGGITVRWWSPLGLWQRQTRVEAPADVRVYPAFEHLRRYGLKAREAEQRLPVRARRRPGGENEFQRLRGYVPGDPYRHIDWKATARRQKFTVREYGQESNQTVLFLVDAGRTMGMTLGARTAFDHALDAAMTMGHAALRHGDRVGLMVFDRSMRVWQPPRTGRRTAARLIQSTYNEFPSLHETDFAAAFRHLSTNVRRRSLVVLLTAVQDEVVAANATAVIRALGSRHLPLVVWLRDPDLTALTESPAREEEEWFARAAAAELVTWRERSLTDLRKRGALVVDCAPDQLTSELLGAYMEIKARRLL